MIEILRNSISVMSKVNYNNEKNKTDLTEIIKPQKNQSQILNL